MRLSVAGLGVLLAGGSALLAPALASRVRSPRGAPAGDYRLVQYPQASRAGFYAQVGAARRSIDMEMYELRDPVAERALAAAARRGVRVRVLLDRDYSGGYVNGAAVAYLRAHGVPVRWAPAHYIFHIKATSFDASVADVSTANLTPEYYATDRDAEVIDANPVQVRAIEQTFAHDWAAAPGGAPRPQTVQASGLVWSPTTGRGSAEAAMVTEIRSARGELDFESEELSDAAVTAALAGDARRGVRCRVVMTDSGAWDGAFARVSRAGCAVHVFPDRHGALYIHEKLVLVDPGTPRASLLIGSQNASWLSLHENRELGLLISPADGGASVIGAVAVTFQRDFAASSSWR